VTGGVRLRLIILLGLLVQVALAAGQASCASGGSDAGGSSGDGGDDSTVVDGGPSDGGKKDSAPIVDASVSKACADNATSYCNQLFMCSPYLLSVEYGDVPTCQMQLGGAYCTDIVTAKGSGWTGGGLEACVAARQALTCQQFLYLKPARAACRPTGTLPMGACRYDTQCGTGYCSIPAGSACGNCVLRQSTGGVCATLSDCDSNLVCSGNRCVVPAPPGGMCDPMTMPCENGMQCISGKCAVGGMANATCDADSGIGCDPNLGVYCSVGTCSAIMVGMINTTCGGSPPAVCYGDGTCSGGMCVPPIQDGQSCDGGVNCMTPSTCNSGTCGLFLASQCH
jgi:hypothetical protein